MKGFTHLAAGAFTGILISQAICPNNSTDALLVIGATSIGSILPDIDVGTSKLGRRIPALAYTIQFLFGHRGIFHSLLLWSIPILYLCLTYPDYLLFTLSCSTGILTHLILDMLNPAGIPLFWPYDKRFHIGPFHSGGIVDWLLGITFTVLSVFLVLHDGGIV